MACLLLHNFIRGEMSHDPIEEAFDVEIFGDGDDNDNGGMEFVDHVEPTSATNQMHDDLAQSMWLNVCFIIREIQYILCLFLIDCGLFVV